MSLAAGREGITETEGIGAAVQRIGDIKAQRPAAARQRGRQLHLTPRAGAAIQRRIKAEVRRADGDKARAAARRERTQRKIAVERQMRLVGRHNRQGMILGQQQARCRAFQPGVLIIDAASQVPAGARLPVKAGFQPIDMAQAAVARGDQTDRQKIVGLDMRPGVEIAGGTDPPPPVTAVPAQPQFCG